MSCSDQDKQCRLGAVLRRECDEQQRRHKASAETCLRRKEQKFSATQVKRNYCHGTRLLVLPLLLLFISLNVHADIYTMYVSTNMTATRGTTNPDHATGPFDAITAVSGAYTASGDTVTLNLSNFSNSNQVTILNVTFEIMMNTSGGWANDNLAIQYSNDSGTTWITAQSGLQPGNSLADFGNFSVLASFGQATTLNSSQVRLSYTRAGGADGIVSGVDGVQMYIDFAPPPTVTLNAPANNVWQTNLGSVNVSFNFTPSTLITLKNCSVYINGTLNTTNQTPLTNGSPNLINITFKKDGDYLWNVTCYDPTFAGTATNAFTLHVDVTPPNLTILSPANLSTVTYSWVNFTFNVTDFSNVSQCILVVNNTIRDTTFNVSKRVAVTMNASLPNGNVSWYINCTDQWNFTNQSGLRFVFVNVSPPIVRATALNVTQGFSMSFVGSNWQAFQNVTINITRSNGSLIPLFNVTANQSGNISFSVFINYTDPIGQYNLTAFEPLNLPRINSTSFNVSRRVPNITTDKAIYSANQLVFVNGSLFSNLTTVLLTVFNTFTGFTGSSSSVAANATGAFNVTWNVTNICNGNYTINATDNNYTTLNASTTFNVSNQVLNALQEPADNVTGNRVFPYIDVVNASDGVVQNVGLTTDGYLQFSFFPRIPAGSTMNWVNITIQHKRTTANVNSFQMYLVQGTVITALAGAGCSGTPPDTLGFTTCNVTGVNFATANNLTVRVNYTTTGAGDAQVDVAYVNYTWTGDTYACVQFGAAAHATTIAGPVAQTANIVLNAGTTKSVECNATFNDVDGQSDILSANATFYTSPSVSSSVQNNQSQYSNASCRRSATDVNSRTFTCSAQLLYYAFNGTWTCNVTGKSIDGIVSNTTNFTVDPLYAINLNTSLLDFGNLAAGMTSGNLSANVSNYGNQLINVSVYGYGSFAGDGDSFICSQENISVDSLHFAANITADYPAKENLSAALKLLRMNLTSQVNANLVQNTSYWQLQLPSNLSSLGQCNGSIVFQAGPA